MKGKLTVTNTTKNILVKESYLHSLNIIKMKLYIKLLSLIKFQKLYESNKFLKIILSETNSNEYMIECTKKELKELIRILDKNNIKYSIKED